MPTFRDDPKLGSKVPMIKTADLNEQCVTNSKILDGCITKEKLAKGTVDATTLANKSVGTEKLSDSSVTNEKISNKAVSTEKLADGSITKEKIFNASITTEKLANESVSAEKLQSGLRNTIASTYDKTIELDNQKANIADVGNAIERLENKIGERILVEGDVTNLPDEEDLTSVSTIDGREVMRLNDRAYEPSNFSGKGYKILRKNIKKFDIPTVNIVVSYAPTSSGDISITVNNKVTTINLDSTTDTTPAIVATKIATALKSSLDDYDVSVSSNRITLTRHNDSSVSPSSINVGNTSAVISVNDSITRNVRKNILTQDMINDPNTVYEIRYDYDFIAEKIRLPENCTLKFIGGCFLNGTLTGENSKISAEATTIFRNIKILGTWLITDIYQSWFNFSTTENIDNKTNFKNVIQLSNPCIVNNIYFSKGTYYTKIYDNENLVDEGALLLKSNTNLYLSDCTIKIIPFKYTHKHLIKITDASNINIYGGTLIGDADTHDYDTTISPTHEWSHGIKIARYSKNITIKDTIIKKVTGDGINIIDSGENETENILIENVTCDSNNREGMSIENGKNIIIRKSSFVNTSSIHKTAPGCGFNIEPWIKNSHVENIVLEDCIFENNYGGVVIQPNKNEENKTSFINNIRISNCSIGNRLTIFFTNELSLNNLKFEENSYFKITDSANISVDNLNSEYIELRGYVDNIVFNKLTVKNRFVSTVENVSNIKIKNSDIELLRASNINNLLLSDNTINTVEISSKYKTYLLNNVVLNMNILYTDLATLINNDIIWNNENSAVLGGILRNNIIRINKNELRLSDAIVINNIVINNSLGVKAAFALTKESGVFEFIDNKVYGFESLLVKNISPKKVRIYSGMLINTSMNYLDDASLEFINGSIDVKNENQRIYLNNKWININTIDVSAKGRPTNNFLGQQFFDKSLNIPCWWNGTKWVSGNGKIAILDKGNTSNRPSLSQEELGFQYYDTTLKKYIVWNGTEWTNMDGTAL